MGVIGKKYNIFLPKSKMADIFLKKISGKSEKITDFLKKKV